MIDNATMKSIEIGRQIATGPGWTIEISVPLKKIQAVRGDLLRSIALVWANRDFELGLSVVNQELENRLPGAMRKDVAMEGVFRIEENLNGLQNGQLMVNNAIHFGVEIFRHRAAAEGNRRHVEACNVALEFLTEMYEALNIASFIDALQAAGELDEVFAKLLVIKKS
jgi:hypothetical protein